MAPARLVAIMGSGETSPTMRGVHRRLIDTVGGGPAMLLDTPFGFQMNADELVTKAVDYFRRSVQRDIEVASVRTLDEIGSLAYEEALRALARARYAFAGPGSPTYALKIWRATPIPQLLEEKLTDGGCVTFASAAALTLGIVTIPVYEIYKVGGPVEWSPDGLNLLARAGLDVAVVPHYNNQEGGSHDTRYCYMGEPRMKLLEGKLPDGAFILGVEEHTAAIIDIDDDSLTVEGVGDVVVRRAGVEQRYPQGSTVPLEQIRRGGGGGGTPAHEFGISRGAGGAASPFTEAVQELVSSFGAAVSGGAPSRAIDVLLRFDRLLWEWSQETFGTDEMVGARRDYRAMMARLVEIIEAREPPRREVIAPFVEGLLDARSRARAEGRWSDADALRDVLIANGIEVRDDVQTTEWEPRV